jgi:hypothetical protein
MEASSETPYTESKTALALRPEACPDGREKSRAAGEKLAPSIAARYLNPSA